MKAVMDASVGIPYVRAEDSSTAVRRWLARWISAGGTLVVPPHFWLEVVNALIRRRSWTGASVLEAVRELRELPIGTIALDEPALVLVIETAERHRLSSYDAQYLALAQLMDLPLLTLDRPLAAAAGSRWIDPVEPSRRLSEPTTSYGVPPRVTWPDYSGAASYLASLRADLKRAEARAQAEAAQAR